MPEFELPDGEYFSLSGSIRAGTGGQTRALLMRNRLFAQHAGIKPTLLTFDAEPVYPEVRRNLTEMGQLVEGMRLVNLYEYFRTADLSDADATGAGLEPLDQFDTETETHPDGTLYRTVHVHRRQRNAAVYDYHRPDGSRYLRMPASTTTPIRASPVLLLNEVERPVLERAALGGLYRFWIRRLTPPGRRAFIISDSRFTLAHLVPLRSRRIHVLHLMHNAHTVGERRWNSTLANAYGTLLSGIRHLDGLVTLTDRQRRDVAARYGRTNNLFVVPNPVELPPRPAVPEPRAQRRFVIVSRLEPQKRLDWAISIFAKVLERVPDATLDIYGDGSLQIPLARQIADLGLGHAVHLRGHDPQARQTLWTATAFLMTSAFEGYPLATLESMSHGCPVISYDITYGPREQISDGVDGFIVKQGDEDAFVDRVVRLVEEPTLAASMSEAAFAKAEQHDHRAFLADWNRVLRTVVRQKASRVNVSAVHLRVDKLELEPAPLVHRLTPAIRSRVSGRLLARWPRRAHLAVAGTFDRPPTLRFVGELTVSGGGLKAKPESVRIRLHAVSDSTSVRVAVPVDVVRSGQAYALSASTDLGRVVAALGPAAQMVTFRLTLTWQNYSWTSALLRPRPADGSLEVSFDHRGTLQLQQHPVC